MMYALSQPQHGGERTSWSHVQESALQAAHLGVEGLRYYSILTSNQSLTSLSQLPAEPFSWFQAETIQHATCIKCSTAGATVPLVQPR